MKKKNKYLIGIIAIIVIIAGALIISADARIIKGSSGRFNLSSACC